MVAGFAVVAAAFVFVCGANDGAAMLALAARHREVPLWAVLALLVSAVAAGPAIFGLAVARTFTERLIDPADPRGPLIVLVAVASAMLLVAALTWRGVPTSITLAVLGALAGAATTAGAGTSWSTLGKVLVVAAAAPFVGGGLGLLLGGLARRLPTTHRLPGVLRAVHVVAFTGQSLAYAANDGQKMFAVAGVGMAVARGAPGMRALGWPVLVALAVTFGAGAVASLRRMARGATFGLLSMRPWRLVSAELAAAAAVFGSAGLGAPVSMTQSMAAGLVGAGASQGVRRVRWQFARPVVLAWLVTLPIAILLGLGVGGLVRASG
ncbi:MAG: inorganic phosphate transporter [Hamadaea sp.]|nr:inorganic phosphate transporter [Hamadaea sp.]NUR50560.1 inorganic phosphate transporter [Hamadaea sp.]NUT06260.1 inorganic phosphate transporter [Hamadaea sp.]